MWIDAYDQVDGGLLEPVGGWLVTLERSKGNGVKSSRCEEVHKLSLAKHLLCGISSSLSSSLANIGFLKSRYLDDLKREFCIYTVLRLKQFFDYVG